MDERRATFFDSGAINGLTLRNRVIKAATFEAMGHGGFPSPALVEHHRRLARGGVGMTTVAYASVSPDGRSYATQLLVTPSAVPRLRELTDAVHAEGAAVSLQLGHCGGFSESRVIGGRPLGPSVVFNAYGLSFSRPMREADMQRVAGDFARATQLAREAGFDAVELHYGHGYLLSQFLSPFTNRRRDRYGGALENRLRFPLLVLDEVRRSVGPAFPLLAKVNLSDGFEGGLTLDESVDVCRALEQHGVDALVLSGGFVSKTPLYMLRGKVPTREMAAAQTRLVRRVGLRLFGRFFVQEYPFREAFFFDEALRIRDAVTLPLVLIGGITRAATIERALAAGFDFVAIGRALLYDPHRLRKLERGEQLCSLCEPCNRCIVEMDRGGVRCIHDTSAVPRA